MEKQWYIYSKKADFKAISEKFGIDKVTARVLRNRDLVSETDISLFLYGSMKDLYDGRRLPDMDKAAALLAEKIREGRRIRIVGDYDIDGVCAVYIMYTAISMCGGRVDQVIPDRIRDGYGINLRIIEEAAAEDVDTLVTVDNGIAAQNELERAKELGMTVIVTDHHDVRKDQMGQDILPAASAVIDPKRSASIYDTQDICGAVVAWKLAEQLFAAFSVKRENWLGLLPFAAIATIGDVMPLIGENRIIVREGLRMINERPRGFNPGLRELIRSCGLMDREIGSYHIGFILGPCINAGGRLESARCALDLFLCDIPERAAEIAEHLKMLNDERKSMTEEGVKAAMLQAEESYPDDKVLCIELPKLHESLAGIVAGRLREHFGKPAFVFTDTEEKGISKGSGRSTEKYHMFEGIRREDGLLIKYGGHPMAAGLSLRTSDIGRLREQLNRNCGLRDEDLIEKLWIDAAMPISYISMQLAEELQRLAPFGTGNPRPVFAEKGLEAYDIRVLGKNKNVLKFGIREETGASVSAIMFGDAEELRARLEGSRRLSVLYFPQINEYNGKRELQLQVLDIRDSSA